MTRSEATKAWVLDDDCHIEIRYVRDSRARRLKLSVNERGVRLTMPPRISRVVADHFLYQHRDWLLQQLTHRHGNAPLNPIEPFATTALPLRDSLVPVRWKPSVFTRIELTSEGMEIALPEDAPSHAVKEAVRQFYEAQARTDIGRWLPGYLQDLPCTPRRIRLKSMSSQWGSLAFDGTVSLDLALVLGRPSAFKYVLVHELCHLIHANHSSAFWREVERRFPNWREEKQYFRNDGLRLKTQMHTLLTLP